MGQFNEAARQGAVRARQERSTMRKAAHAAGGIQVFVTRAENRYGWEIRKFGSLVMQTGAELYDDQDAARLAGEGAMSLSGRSEPAGVASSA